MCTWPPFALASARGSETVTQPLSQVCFQVRQENRAELFWEACALSDSAEGMGLWGHSGSLAGLGKELQSKSAQF